MATLIENRKELAALQERFKAIVEGSGEGLDFDLVAPATFGLADGATAAEKGGAMGAMQVRQAELAVEISRQEGMAANKGIIVPGNKAAGEAPLMLRLADHGLGQGDAPMPAERHRTGFCGNHFPGSGG